MTTNDKPGAIDPVAAAKFGPRGHGTIGIIAMRDLEARSPATKAIVDEILGADPKGRSDYFVAANWADHVRNERRETAPWHYVDMPYRPGHPDPNPPLPAPPTALSKLPELTQELKDTDDPEAKADALCFVLHIVGDLHQPLHCATRVTQGHADGDHGGNSFLLSGDYEKLHSLWDDSVNMGVQDRAEELADGIMAKHPRGSVEGDLGSGDPEAWARASYQVAVHDAYGPLEGKGARPTPSSDYLANTRKVAQRQAALGGYRLADWLIASLGAA